MSWSDLDLWPQHSNLLILESKWTFANSLINIPLQRSWDTKFMEVGACAWMDGQPENINASRHGWRHHKTMTTYRKGSRDGARVNRRREEKIPFGALQPRRYSYNHAGTRRCQGTIRIHCWPCVSFYQMQGVLPLNAALCFTQPGQTDVKHWQASVVDEGACWSNQ